MCYKTDKESVMNNKKLFKNIGISMIMKPISIILAMVYTPLALAYLGDTKYGIWSIILNIISWINYFDIGIGNGLRNKLTEAITLKDEESANKYVSTAYYGTGVISFIFCLVFSLIWIGFNLNSFFKLNMSNENINIIIFISVLFVCINFVLSLSKVSAYSIQQPGIISIIGVIGQLIQIIVVIILLKRFSSSVLIISVSYGSICLFESILVYLYITRKRKYLIPKRSSVRKEYLKPLLTLGLGFFMLQISSLVFNTTDGLLISYLYGSEDVTPYSVAYKAFYIIVQVHAIIIMPMWSAFTEASTKRDMNWIKNMIKKLNISTLFFSLCVIVGIVFFEPIAEIWLHKKLEYGDNLILFMGIYVILQMIGNNYSSFLCGVGYIKVSTIVAFISAIINIPLSLFFAEKCNMFLSGVILGSVVVISLSAIILPITSHIWIRKKMIEWDKI